MIKLKNIIKQQGFNPIIINYKCYKYLKSKENYIKLNILNKLNYSKLIDEYLINTYTTGPNNQPVLITEMQTQHCGTSIVIHLHLENNLLNKVELRQPSIFFSIQIFYDRSKPQDKLNYIQKNNIYFLSYDNIDNTFKKLNKQLDAQILHIYHLLVDFFQKSNIE